MTTYEDKNIKVELKKKMTEEEILAVTFWLLCVCGHEVELPDLTEIEPDELYFND